MPYNFDELNNRKNSVENYEKEMDRKLDELIGGFYEAARKMNTPIVRGVHFADGTISDVYPVIGEYISGYGLKSVWMPGLAVSATGELLFNGGRSFRQNLINDCDGYFDAVEEVLNRALIGKPCTAEDIKSILKTIKKKYE